jgi:signal transduction histidine kinase
MRRVWWKWLVLWAGILICSGHAVSAETSQRSVLVLDQSSAGLPFNTALTSAIRATLNAGSTQPISFYSENLDANRFVGQQYEQDFARFLQAKYRDRPIDVVVAVGVAALDFILHNRAELWPSAPVIFTAIDETTASRLKLPENVTGLTMQLTLRDMVSVARMVVPDLRRIALVGDPLDRQTFYRHFKEEVPLIASQFEIIDLQNMRMAELKDRLGRLPEDTAVIYTGIYFDNEGISYVPGELVTPLAARANRPLIASISSHLNRGAVGGYIVQADPIGQQTARVALRILGGESASSIPVSRVPSALIFEWPALQRWNISEADLPAGSEVRFRQVGAWEQYRSHVLVAAGAIMLQAALITWLLFERRRRTLAEITSREAMAEMTYMNRRAGAGELSASIAHEINQPLTAVAVTASAALMWLRRDPPDLDEAREALEDIVKDTHRAGDVVKTIRAMFRKDSRPGSVDINRITKSVLELARVEMNKHGIEVQTELGQLPVFTGDAIQLQQVVMNLVMNAIEAMHAAETRVLRIRSEMATPSIMRLSVEDTGSGIGATDIDRVFTPMFSTKAGGMGMGLSICRTIVENHGGRIWAQSRPGGGATFRFELPVVTRSKEAQPVEPAEPVPA